MPLRIIRDDITKVKADAIVNTCNPEVAIGSGVDKAIYEAAGREKLLAKRAEIGVLLPGEVGITPAFDLKAKYIIHASGPWWEGGEHGEEELLKQCYEKSLFLAKEKKCRSIAFPLLATGTYGFPKKLGIKIAVDVFKTFLEENEMEIYLVVFGDSAVKISGELGEEVHSFIDGDYVKRAYRTEYSLSEDIGSVLDDETTVDTIIGARPDRPLSSKVSSDKVKPGEITPGKAASNKVPLSEQGSLLGESVVCYGAKAPKKAASPKKSLEDVLKGIYKDSFAKHLQKLINKKGLKNSEVYAAANISKQYFSKLLKGQVKPSKEKVLALAVGLKLNLDEAVDFLGLAGYALSPISQTDAVVAYFLEHKDYNVLKIDIVLFDYGLDPLSSN